MIKKDKINKFHLTFNLTGDTLHCYGGKYALYPIYPLHPEYNSMFSTFSTFKLCPLCS